jgi:hypothetical protein
LPSGKFIRPIFRRLAGSSPSAALARFCAAVLAFFAASGEVTAYRLRDDGRLDAVPGVANLGTGLAGLAAR